ncbi:VanZ family protein [Micromonospora sp. NPDC023737]|uniref:VanZ family protein n=1 Tax=unclassified Micromonospora TaxID=2617518 RepID=UPI0033E1CFDE
MHLTESLITLVLFALLAPVAVLPWIGWHYAHYGQLRGWSAVIAGAAALYSCGVLAFTLFPLPPRSAATCVGDHFQLRPLASVADALRAGHGDLVTTVTSTEFAQVALNVVLFAPLGFLLRYRFRRGLLVTALLGLGGSLLIEVTQGTAVFDLYPCPYRVADVDDLMTNTLGAVAGWLIAVTVGRALPAAVPDHVDDLAAPRLLRRGLAMVSDLALVGIAGSAVGGALTLLAEPLAHRYRTLVDLIAIVAVALATTLVVPLLRRDRATLGQVIFALAPARAGANGGSAAVTGPANVVRRFVGWWLPAVVLVGIEHTNIVAAVILLLGVVARIRHDRRTPVDLLAGTVITTRAALVGRDHGRQSRPVIAAPTSGGSAGPTD